MNTKTKAFLYRTLALLPIVLILSLAGAFESGAVSLPVFLGVTLLCLGSSRFCILAASEAEKAQRRQLHALRQAGAAKARHQSSAA